MDALDADILREMLRDRAVLWGGGDPRVAMSELAERVGVSRTTVWARLRAWRREGFLVREEVVPNPALFGAGLAAGDVRVDDPRRKPEVLESLALVDGILAGADQVGPYVLLLYAHETPSALARCTRLIGRLPHVDEVGMCLPFAPPPPTIAPTPTDWRILLALRRAPERSVAKLAEDAGVSARTFTRRYRELLAANAIWWFPVFDFTRWRGSVLARFLVMTKDARAAAAAISRCRRERTSLVWWAAAPGELAPAEGGWFEALFRLDAAPEVEETQRWLLELAGVTAVEPFFPRCWFVLPAWFDERVERRVAGARRRGRSAPRHDR